MNRDPSQSEALAVVGKTKLWQRLRDEAQAEITEKRSAAAAEITRIDEQLERDFPATQTAFVKAQAKVVKARELLQAAEREVKAAYLERANVTAVAERAKAPHIKLLSETVDAAVAALRDRISRVYPQQAPRGEAPSKGLVELNAARAAAIRELDAMPMLALEPQDLRDRLDAIRENAKLPANEPALV
jgi:hypothetical protein